MRGRSCRSSAVLAVLVLSSAVRAQEGNPLVNVPVRPAHLQVAAHVGAVVAAPGATVSLLADITPNPGIHVYAPGSKGYVPIALTVGSNKEITPGKIVYPQSETLFFAPLSETVLVYQKPFRLTRPVTLAKSVKSGTTVVITGSVDYQACDDKICFVPETVPVSWSVRVK
jgi:DsbC/DsbD-like thiol-disulfide interchange protein